jgi:hypothetical protein
MIYDPLTIRHEGVIEVQKGYRTEPWGTCHCCEAPIRQRIGLNNFYSVADPDHNGPLPKTVSLCDDCGSVVYKAIAK